MRCCKERHRPASPGEEGPCAAASDPADLSFGTVRLSDDQAAFYAIVNRQIPALCRSLPSALQTEALLFFLRYAGVSLGDGMDFFGRFPAPAWSIVYWLSRRRCGAAAPSRRTTALAIRAHALAMCLHSLDDHLVDGDLPLTPLALLLRSQAWSRMRQALDGLVHDLPEGRTLIDEYLGDYHAAIGHGTPAGGLEDYCRHFRRQMATGFMVPALLTLGTATDRQNARRIEAAFGSFGIAWRLLDDLQDFRYDLSRGFPSAVYLCLGEEGQALWNLPINGDPSSGADRAARVSMRMRADKVCERLCARIGRELGEAAEIMDRCDLPGMARELRWLGRPFHDGGEAAS